MPATPLQIIRYGHIATTIRETMARCGLSPQMVSKAINVTPSAVYGWCAAKNAPNDLYRPALAKLLGLPETSLMPNEKGAKPLAEVVPYQPPKPKTGNDPLAFNIDLEGNCRIRVDITLPPAQGIPLLRMLLDIPALQGDHRHD